MAAFKARGGHVLVGTPGRLSDVFERAEGTLDARRLEALVLDEADRLLDAGYGKHLEALMRRLPKQRRTGAAPLRPLVSWLRCWERRTLLWETVTRSCLLLEFACGFWQ